MVSDGIPADLRDFITKCIDSVGQLEALLLLRDSADEAWGVAALAKRLYVNEAEATAILIHLVGQGLVGQQDGLYRYVRQSEQAATIDRLAEAYARQLIPITNLIHAKPRRIRAFADAFKIKRDK
ncbi:hypothetical protein [Dongia sedimenti]|uniref:MarR family transcriptional regulator n=1 Tax=Dongia sedimenti TaxID=3064282 RepID=A0ABU0YIV9_9PROT|nr:hypothetical protein [Rhodospirillaceae bacterium R-7]